MAKSALPQIAAVAVAFIAIRAIGRSMKEATIPLQDYPGSDGEHGPDFSKPTPSDAPGTVSKVGVGYDIQLWMGHGGNIEKAIIDAPDGSNPEADLRLKDGEGHERIVLGFNKAGGQWAVTLKGTRGDTGEHMERTWVLEPVGSADA